ncbi:MAG: WbqC family protein [Leadbetterella sp.]
MKVGIMQPYLLPYIGYLQLIAAVDVFVVYDNIQFSKKGWFHRNRFLLNGKDEYFSLNLKSDSDYLNVDQRMLSDAWFATEKDKTLRRLTEAYRKAPFYKQNWPLIEDIFQFQESNLFKFIFHSLEKITAYLSIKTPLKISSEIAVDHTLKSQSKVIAICESLHATTYINPIGGLELYDETSFNEKGIDLLFQKSRLPKYPQFNNEFIPALSILDILMFNDVETIRGWMNEFDFVKKATI